MTEGSKITSAAAGRRGVDLRATLILTMLWSLAPGAVHADILLLQSGESIEGSIVDATRNSVVVRRAIGGMRQMPIRDIAEVRIDLAGGRSISGSILSWADGVHRLRVDDEVVSVRAGRVVSRVPYEEPAQSSPATPPRRAQPQPRRETAAAPGGSPVGDAASGRRTDQPAAAADSPAEEGSAPATAESPRTESPAAAPNLAPESDERAAAAPAAGGDTFAGGRAPADRPAAAESPAPQAAKVTPPESAADESPSADEAAAAESPAPRAADAASPGSPADESPPADEAAAAGSPAPRAAERAGPPESTPAHGGVAGGIIAKSAAAREATGASQTLAIKGSVDPVGADAAELVFKIQLSRPAEHTLVLVYGTMDGTAKAGQDYEPRQGILTLAPGTTSADIHVPLLGQQPRDGDARFELFLAADPKVANVVDARVVATIPGED